MADAGFALFFVSPVKAQKAAGQRQSSEAMPRRFMEVWHVHAFPARFLTQQH